MSHRLSLPLGLAFLFTLFVSTPAIAACERDADGSCSRPVACDPPKGGKCTTIPRLPGASQFGCECQVKKKTFTQSRMRDMDEMSERPGMRDTDERSMPPGHTLSRPGAARTVAGAQGGASPVMNGLNPANTVGECFEAPDCKGGHMATMVCQQCGNVSHGGSWLRNRPPPTKCFNLRTPGDCPR